MTTQDTALAVFEREDGQLSEMLDELDGLLDAMKAEVPPEEASILAMIGEMEVTAGQIMAVLSAMRSGIVTMAEQRDELIQQIETMNEDYSRGAALLFETQSAYLKQMMLKTFQEIIDDPERAHEIPVMITAVSRIFKLSQEAVLKHFE